MAYAKTTKTLSLLQDDIFEVERPLVIYLKQLYCWITGFCQYSIDHIAKHAAAISMQYGCPIYKSLQF